jgi:hypothetical protein
MLDPERLKADSSGQGRPNEGPALGRGGRSDRARLVLANDDRASVGRATCAGSSVATSWLLQERPLLWTMCLIVLRRASFGLRAMVVKLEMERGANTDWLQSVVGNPQDYDAPLDGRVNVCARLLPSTYLSVKRTKKQLGFRTIAGTWEYIIRLGLAVASR